MVKRALEDSQQVEKVVCCDNIAVENLRTIVELCERNRIAYYRVSRGIMAAMTTTNPLPELLSDLRRRVQSG